MLNVGRNLTNVPLSPCTGRPTVMMMMILITVVDTVYVTRSCEVERIMLQTWTRNVIQYC